MNILHPEKIKPQTVKKNITWFVKNDEHKISFEDFGKRRMKLTEDEKIDESKVIRHC